MPLHRSTDPAARGRCAFSVFVVLASLAACGGSPDGPMAVVPGVEEPPSGFLRFTSIAVGATSACGLMADGSTYCWGQAPASDRPRRLAGAPPFRAIDMYADWGLFMCGLTEQGTAHCHRRGELVAVPAAAPFASLAAGAAVCASTAAGEAYCWTYDTGAGTFHGVLGDGGAAPDPYIEGTPVAVAGGHRFQALAATHLMACGITTAGSAYCWGQHNFTHQMGDGDPSEFGRPAPSPVAGGQTFLSLSVSSAHGCGVATGDVAYCWGFGAFGQLGNPAAPTVACPGPLVGDQAVSCVATPTAVTGGHRFTAIAAGGLHTCALDREGRAFCWGANAWGQLGNGTRGAGAVERSPVPVAGGLRFRSIAAGEFHACAIATNDATYCWGSNQAGQLGAGLHLGEVRTVPHPVALPVN